MSNNSGSNRARNFKSALRFVLVQFWNYSREYSLNHKNHDREFCYRYDYRPNWTPLQIISASHNCDLCDFVGTRDFGWWFLADLLSGYVSTIILMRKCDSKHREICFNRAFIKNITKKSMFASGCFKTSCCVLCTVRWDNVDFGRICGGRKRDSAHVGRITKIVDCIWIVFGLPYNYKPNLSLKMI